MSRRFRGISRSITTAIAGNRSLLSPHETTRSFTQHQSLGYRANITWPAARSSSLLEIPTQHNDVKLKPIKLQLITIQSRHFILHRIHRRAILLSYWLHSISIGRTCRAPAANLSRTFLDKNVRAHGLLSGKQKVVAIFLDCILIFLSIEIMLHNICLFILFHQYFQSRLSASAIYGLNTLN